MYLIGIMMNSDVLNHHLLDDLHKRLNLLFYNNNLVCILFVKSPQNKLTNLSLLNKYDWIYDIITYDDIIKDGFHEAELIKHLTLYTYSPNSQPQSYAALPMAS